MLKVLSNQIYVCFISDTEKLIQNIERFRLFDSVGAQNRIFPKLLIKTIDFGDF